MNRARRGRHLSRLRGHSQRTSEARQISNAILQGSLFKHQQWEERQLVDYVVSAQHLAQEMNGMFQKVCFPYMYAIQRHTILQDHDSYIRNRGASIDKSVFFDVVCYRMVHHSALIYMR